MSENTSEERNNLFRDYKTENFEDSDLQSRLYAEIYYEPNIEGESETSNISKAIQFANMITELNNENVQQKPGDKQPLELEAAKDKSNKAKKISREHCNQNISLSNESSVTEALMYNDTLHAQNSSDDPVSDKIQTNTSELSSQEISAGTHEHDNISNDNSGNSSVEKEKCKERAKKHKSSNYTKSKHQKSSPKDHTASVDTIHSKYNVLSKCVKQEIYLNKQLMKDKQTSDSSDSEESIFEVPVPPKPKPPLINLQDSDEENDTNSEMSNLISEKITSATSDKITSVASSDQDTSKNKNNESLHKNTTLNPGNKRMQEIKEDIVLNRFVVTENKHCTVVQRGAKVINEIKQSSKNAKLNKNQGDLSTEDTNENSTKQLSQNISKENNTFQQEICTIAERHSDTRMQQNIDKNNAHSKYNLKSVDKNNTLDAKISCSNNDTAMDRKRRYDNRIENPKEKRRCIVQQNNVMQPSSSSGERRNESRNEYFNSMSDTLRDHYYNKSRSQENFDVSELQQSMSKDPRMWMILDEDLMPCPPSRQRTRFWNVRCTNCQRIGHQRYDCTEPRRIPCCYICGEKGHVESRCSQKICLTCGKQQNTFRKTCEYCRVLYCTMCHSIGHESTQCPDLWRRYHQTTDSSAPQNPGNVMKPSGLLHCCNCTKRGHESSKCKEYRWSQHFQTPAAVTNYMDGPMYTYGMSFSDLDYEANILSPRASSSRSIPYSPINISQTMEEHSQFFSVNTFSSSTKAYETPIPQRTLYNSEIEENLESSPVINKMLQSEEEQHRQNEKYEEEFTTIFFSYGEFPNKNNKNAQIFSRNLSLLKNDLSTYGKKTVISTLPKRKISPVFLQALCDKKIEFEVKIGSPIHQHDTIMLQIIARKEYIKFIYSLLLHWINLPDEEKDYGMDVTLPMIPIKMFNLLSSRMLQLRKMKFTCYDEHITGLNDPRWLFKRIKELKIQLQQHKGSRKQYMRLRNKMWRFQMKLLMIVNTEPRQNAYIYEYYKIMKQFQSKMPDQMPEKFDNKTYLKLTLLYNRLFVPHTPVGLFKTLLRIEKHAENRAKNAKQSPQILQELKNDVMCVQENPLATSSQNINSTENPSAINIQQNTNDEMLIQRRDSNISSMINDAIGYENNDNRKVILIEDPIAQESQTSMSLNTEALNYGEPTLIPMEDRNEDQPLTSSPNIEYNTSTNKQDINVKNMKKLTKKERRKQRKELKMKEKQKIAANIYQEASHLIEEVRAFNLPHMMNAANELERKINNQTIKLKHVTTMKKMITLEKRYRKDVSSFWQKLKA